MAPNRSQLLLQTNIKLGFGEELNREKNGRISCKRVTFGDFMIAEDDNKVKMDSKGLARGARILGKHLRANCDKILDKTSPFVVDSAQLWFITETIQCILSGDVTMLPDQSEEFYDYIMFLSDFFEQTPSLCVTLSDAVKGVNSIPGNLDLVYFRSLEFLELRKVPPHMVASIHYVKSKLKKLKCSRCVDSVFEVLQAHNVPGNVKFKGNTQQEVVQSPTLMTIWPELKEIDLSFNRITSIGQDAIDSFEMTPSVESMNLSRNKIYSIDDSFSKALMCLRVLNLNYNQLKEFPPVPPTVKTLLLSHNYISCLDPEKFQSLKNLEVLDMSGNMIADENYLDALDELRVIKMLSLMGNPVSYLERYRMTVCSKLNRYALNRTFVLDGKKLSVNEVRKGLAVTRTPKFVPFRVGDPRVDASLTRSYESGSSSIRSSCKKKPRVREPQVFDPDEEEEKYEEDGPSSSSRLLLSTSVRTTGSSGDSEQSEEATVTRNQIQSLIAKYGEENWLLKQSGDEVSKLLGIPMDSHLKQSSPTLSQSLPGAATPLFVKSNSTSSFYTTATEFDDSKLFRVKLGEQEEIPETSQVDINTSDDNLVFYNTATSNGDADDPLPSMSSSMSSTLEVSLPEEDPNTLVDEEGRAIEFTYFRAGQKCKLVILDNCLYDMNPDKEMSFVSKWHLRDLEAIEDQEINKDTETVEFRILFDTLKMNLREVVFIMPQTDFGRFDEAVSPYLQSRLEKEFAEAFQCLKCHAQFSKGSAGSSVVTDKKGIPKQVPACNNPDCRSLLLVLLDSAPLPQNETFGAREGLVDDATSGHLEIPQPIANLDSFLPLQCSTPTQSYSFDLSSSQRRVYLPRELTPVSGEANRNDRLPDSANENVFTNKSESDVETISAASSSIEVLGAQCDSGSSSDVEKVPEAYEVPVHASASGRSHLGPGMSESTSSGSCADSVCTTYEHKVADGIRHSAETCNDLSFNMTLSTSTSSTVTLVGSTPRTPLSKLAEYSSATTAPIRYDYDQYTTVDHRLQLFCEITVFKGNAEKLVALAKAFVITEDKQFPGILIFSNQKLYIYTIVDLEGDKPDTWLQKHNAFPLNKISGLNVLIGRHGVGIDVNGKYYAVIFRDTNRTENFLTCYFDIARETESSPLVRDFSQTHKVFLSPDHPVVYFGIPDYMDCDGDKSRKSGLLLNDQELIFIKDLTWMGSVKTGNVTATKAELISDLRLVETCEMNEGFVKLIFGTSSPVFWTVRFETREEKTSFEACLKQYATNATFISLSQPIEA